MSFGFAARFSPGFALVFSLCAATSAAAADVSPWDNDIRSAVRLIGAGAVLIALTQSPTLALYTAIMYLAIQTLEGFVLTPLVQQRAISLPPVAVISAQLLLGVLFGFLGLLLAVPIVAVVFVLVKMLYVEDILGNEVEVKGENDVEY